MWEFFRKSEETGRKHESRHLYRRSSQYCFRFASLGFPIIWANTGPSADYSESRWMSPVATMDLNVPTYAKCIGRGSALQCSRTGRSHCGIHQLRLWRLRYHPDKYHPLQEKTRFSTIDFNHEQRTHCHRLVQQGDIRKVLEARSAPISDGSFRPYPYKVFLLITSAEKNMKTKFMGLFNHPTGMDHIT